MDQQSWPYRQYGPIPTPRETDGYLRVVLVTGSRYWDDPTAIEDVLTFIAPNVLLHGAAAGADWIADRWAKDKGVVREPFKIPDSHWRMMGRSAGPTRNRAMVQRAVDYDAAGHKVLVLGFPHPDSTGTIDCMEQAVFANLPVLRYQ